MKQCKTCKQFLSFNKFFKRANGHLRSSCKICINKQNLNNYYVCDKLNRAKVSYRYALKVNYNLSEEEYNQLYTNQNGKCSICNKELSNRFLNKEGFKSAVDHCHKTGKIRSILCNLCNKALGAFKDDLTIVKEAVNYLETHSI